MNNEIKNIYGFDDRLMELAQQAEENCREAFARID